MGYGVVDLQVECERDRDILTGKRLVRIRYRERGTRRWRKCLVVLDEHQTYGLVMNRAREIAELHAVGKVREADSG